MKTLIGMILAAFMAGVSTGAKVAPEEKSVTVEQTTEKIAAGDQLLDVRTKEEWDEGHLKGAKRVTLSDEGFVEKVRAVLDPQKPVVVYCRSGNRSAKAAKLLREAGFTMVVEMAGGIIEWEKEGKPVVK